MDGEKEGVGSTVDLSSKINNNHTLPKAEKDMGKACVILDASR